MIAPAPLVHTPPLALLHPAARQLGYGLCPGDPDQGGYWLSRGGRCLWLPDRAAVNRVLTIGTGPPYFGWEEGQDYEDFAPGGLGPFYSGQKLTDNFILTDDGFRVLILAKAFSNICDGSIQFIGYDVDGRTFALYGGRDDAIQ